MIGYRGRYEYLGKASARLDDVRTSCRRGSPRRCCCVAGLARRAGTSGAAGASARATAAAPRARTPDGRWRRWRGCWASCSRSPATTGSATATRRSRPRRSTGVAAVGPAPRSRWSRSRSGGDGAASCRCSPSAARVDGRAAHARRHRRRGDRRARDRCARRSSSEHERQSLRSGAGGRRRGARRGAASATRIRSAARARAALAAACAHDAGARRRRQRRRPSSCGRSPGCCSRPATRCWSCEPAFSEMRAAAQAPRRAHRRLACRGAATGFAARPRRDRAPRARHARPGGVAVRAGEPERAGAAGARRRGARAGARPTWRSSLDQSFLALSERHADAARALARQRRVRAQPHQGARDPRRARRLPARRPRPRGAHRVVAAGVDGRRRGAGGGGRRVRRAARFVAATPPRACSPSASRWPRPCARSATRPVPSSTPFFLVPVRGRGGAAAPLADAAPGAGARLRARSACRGTSASRRAAATTRAASSPRSPPRRRRAPRCGARHEPHALAHRARRRLPDPPAGAGVARRRGRRRALGRVLPAGRARARRARSPRAPRVLAGHVPDSVLAVLVAALLAALTGALHLDGVADTFDALGAPGADRARRLEILRDSRIGAHGATRAAVRRASRGDRAARGARRRTDRAAAGVPGGRHACSRCWW